MDYRDNKRSLILQSLYEQTKFRPVLSGSHFFGTNSEQSDFDYICAFDESSIAFLELNEFKAIDLQVNKYNLFAVFRNDDLKMDCIMLKNPERRLQSMKLLKQFGLGGYLKDKAFAKRIFLVITRLEQIQQAGREFTYDGIIL